MMKRHSSSHLDASETVGYYDLDLKVEGALKGVKLDLLWECIGAKRSYIEIDACPPDAKSRFSKILVIDLEKIGKLVQLFDELGIKKLDDLPRKTASLESGDDRSRSV